jgi:hypothetical protein
MCAKNVGEIDPKSKFSLHNSVRSSDDLTTANASWFLSFLASTRENPKQSNNTVKHLLAVDYVGNYWTFLGSWVINLPEVIFPAMFVVCSLFIINEEKLNFKIN